jgi:hypothetical protein
MAVCVSATAVHDSRTGPPRGTAGTVTCSVVTSTLSARTPVGVSIICRTVLTSSAELTSSAQASATSAATNAE